MLSRLQVRFADGELERLGIVNLSSSANNNQGSSPSGGVLIDNCSKLYICHISKDKTFEDVNKVFSTAGDIEELYLFKDSLNNDEFKGSCFIKYSNRKEALRAIYKFNQKSRADTGAVGRLVEEGSQLEVRFADKKRKDNIPLSMIPVGLLNAAAAGGVSSVFDPNAPKMG